LFGASRPGGGNRPVAASGKGDFSMFSEELWIMVKPRKTALMLFPERLCRIGPDSLAAGQPFRMR
jgi:hypothetical protein